MCGSGLIVKRVVGLPGETIAEKQGIMYADGQKLAEPYAWVREPAATAQFGRLESGYFVMGDNRLMSCDSRRFGPIAREAIVGRVIRVLRSDDHRF